jgi:hypothetical protein
MAWRRRIRFSGRQRNSVNHKAYRVVVLRRTVCGGHYGSSMTEFASNTHQADDTASILGASSDDVSNPALQKDPDDWVSGDDPMTAAQRSYLDTLAKQAGEELPGNLSKAEASQHIDRLKSQLGIGES